MKLTEKERAEYLRLLTNRDRAALGAQRAMMDVSDFFIQMRDLHQIQFYPFDIDANTGEIKETAIPSATPRLPPTPTVKPVIKEKK